MEDQESATSQSHQGMSGSAGTSATPLAANTAICHVKKRRKIFDLLQQPAEFEDKNRKESVDFFASTGSTQVIEF